MRHAWKGEMEESKSPQYRRILRENTLGIVPCDFDVWLWTFWDHKIGRTTLMIWYLAQEFREIVVSNRRVLSRKCLIEFYVNLIQYFFEKIMRKNFCDFQRKLLPRNFFSSNWFSVKFLNKLNVDLALKFRNFHTVRLDSFNVTVFRKNPVKSTFH